VDEGFGAASGTTSFGSVNCPAGTVVIGGGDEVIGNSSGAVLVNASVPDGDGGWEVYMENVSGVETDFGVNADCAAEPKNYVIESSNPVSVPPGAHSANVNVSCPAGLAVLGGGGMNEDLNDMYLSSSYPIASTKGTTTTYKWRTDANNVSSETSESVAVAICAKPLSGYTIEVSAPVDVPPSAEDEAIAGCPSGTQGETFVMGGGTRTSTKSTAIAMSTGFPYIRKHSTSWDVIPDNGSSSDISVKSYAVCAL